MAQCFSPMSVKDKKTSKYITIPCGNCPACLSKNQNDWSFRIQEELKVSSSAYFITLTYDDKNLPYSKYGLPTLQKSELQKAIKRLRKYNLKIDPNSQKIKYYAIGEYGSITHRPHYHLLIFNITNKKPIYQIIENIWYDGLIHIGKVEPGSINYTTKHQVQKLRKYTEVEPEFQTMSQGLGKNYINRTKSYHKKNKMYFVRNVNGHLQRIPKYFKDKIFTEYERKKYSHKAKQESLIASYQEELRIEKLGSNPFEYQLQQKIQATERALKKLRKKYLH